MAAIDDYLSRIAAWQAVIKGFGLLCPGGVKRLADT
jgi:hypothetical protein